MDVLCCIASGLPLFVLISCFAICLLYTDLSYDTNRSVHLAFSSEDTVGINEWILAHSKINSLKNYKAHLMGWHTYGV